VLLHLARLACGPRYLVLAQMAAPFMPLIAHDGVAAPLHILHRAFAGAATVQSVETASGAFSLYLGEGGNLFMAVSPLLAKCCGTAAVAA
jgi:hypothetical protein